MIKRKLGIDLGTKTCGFAISDPLGIISSALENFFFEENQFDLVIQRIKKYVQEYDIDVFVLGYPTKMTGAKSERTLMVEDFHQKLLDNFEQKVVLIDERETTKKAEEIMISAGLSRKKRKKHKDKLAAQLILDDYLMRL
ncbi:Holliday junction resolvase RuvX [Mycoplasma procyoni]|uniref:Holliday junction resolvase RuvX n=1 Tax=Mycoplasma procyoni TaxID=568784 RepID=UPI00197C7770|nr:Holliday junction resolvase RuvX [Mycoplasma procyoni]MBN3534413.1 Holliday junction resolvase RuvX [Mycoplasma procyoni]